MPIRDGSTEHHRRQDPAPAPGGRRSSASALTGRFRVVALSPDGVSSDASGLDRGTAIAYAQALQHRVALRDQAAGPVYEVLDAAGEPVWRGNASRPGVALHPRTVDRSDDRPDGAAADAA